jgi:hypothetical protein
MIVRVATQTLERTIPLLPPWDETFDISEDDDKKLREAYKAQQGAN